MMRTSNKYDFSLNLNRIQLLFERDSEGLLERNTEAVLKAARLGDVPMLTQLHNEVTLNFVSHMSRNLI